MLYLAKGDTVTLLQRVMALAKELKQQVSRRFGKVGQVPRKRQATSWTQLEGIKNYEK